MCIYNLDLVCKDFFEFSDLLFNIKSDILSNFHSRSDIVEVQIENSVITMTKGRLLVNLFLVKPLVKLLGDFKISKNDLYQFDVINEKNLEAYFNKLIRRSKNADDGFNADIREDIYEIINEISDISGRLNVLFGNTISFRDFIRLSIEDEEADKLFNGKKLEYGLQFNEIESKFSECGKKLEKLFERHKESELYPFVVAGTGINKKQLTQCLGFVGLKPDINGDVIPHAIEDNFLNGLTNVENYLINCKGTRKSLITNFKMVRRSGLKIA